MTGPREFYWYSTTEDIYNHRFTFYVYCCRARNLDQVYSVSNNFWTVPLHLIKSSPVDYD